MKELTCEMCGSNNVIKQEGLFVCQICNTKYSVEEAKKIMFEGTVKIDHSDELNNLYTLARRARDNNKYGEMCEYYNQILLKDPNSWEANFYPNYCSLPNDLDLNTPSIGSKVLMAQYLDRKSNYVSGVLKELILILDMVLGIIKEYPIEKQEQYIHEIFNYIMPIFRKFSADLDFFHSHAKGLFSNKSDKPYYNCKLLIINFYTTFANDLILNFENTFSNYVVDIWKNMMDEYGKFERYTIKKKWDTINTVANNIKKYEPNYQIPIEIMEKF